MSCMSRLDSGAIAWCEIPRPKTKQNHAAIQLSHVLMYLIAVSDEEGMFMPSLIGRCTQFRLDHGYMTSSPSPRDLCASEGTADIMAARRLLAEEEATITWARCGSLWVSTLGTVLRPSDTENYNVF